MAKPKSQAQQDLDSRIVGTARDAERVAEVCSVFPRVLFQDARVQRAFDAWRERMARCEDAGNWSQSAVVQAMTDDARELAALIEQLGLGRYRWLIRALRFEFQRRLEEMAGCDFDTRVTLPRVTWAAEGRAPKRGETHQEDIEQSLTLFYRARVNGELPTAIAAEYARAKGITEGRAQVKNRIRRAEQLLNCVNAPLPIKGSPI